MPSPDATDAAHLPASILEDAAIDGLKLALPGILSDIGGRFGNRVALRFARIYGGTYLHLPARVRPEHPIARDFGPDLLAFLIAEFGHTSRVTVPKAGRSFARLRNRRALELSGDGLSASAVATECGVHIRTVQRLRAAGRRIAKKRNTQPKDFDQ